MHHVGLRSAARTVISPNTLTDVPRFVSYSCARLYVLVSMANRRCTYFEQWFTHFFSFKNIVIGEELLFEDTGVDGISRDMSMNVDRTQGYGDKVRVGSTYTRSDKSYSSQAPDSPGGSIGSIASRGSDAARSIKSLTSLRSQKERMMP